jgi:hypothetical protein
MSTISVGTTNVNSFIVSTDTTGNLVLQSSGSSITLSNTANTIIMGGSILTSGTAVASTSGTAISFTGIPSWVKRIIVMFSGLSTSGSSDFLVRLGTSGGVVSTGYLGSSSVVSSGVASTAFTTGFGIAQFGQGTGYVGHGMMTICLLNSSTNIWVQSGTMGESDTNRSAFFGGSVTLSGVVTTVTITTVNGTDTFDAGSINIFYE